MTHPFEDQLAKSWPPSRWRDVGVVLAVSGGADSVALLRAIVALAKGSDSSLFVAHFNHRTRSQADEDEEFVRTLCKQHGLTCRYGLPEQDLGSVDGAGFEEAARAARYDFLRRSAQSIGARYIVTAHTADDQAETVLHRIIRGTGIAGLAGIPRTRELAEGLTVIRPLLHIRRRECVDYLAALKQQYRTDSSNADRRYTRNRLRHDLLPEMADYNDDIHGALTRLSGLASEASEVVDTLVEQLLIERLSPSERDDIELTCDRLEEVHPFLVREMIKAAWTRKQWPLQDMSYGKWEQLASLALGTTEDSTQVCLPSGVRAKRIGASLQLVRATA